MNCCKCKNVNGCKEVKNVNNFSGKCVIISSNAPFQMNKNKII